MAKGGLQPGWEAARCFGFCTTGTGLALSCAQCSQLLAPALPCAPPRPAAPPLAQITAIEVFGREKAFRPKVAVARPAPKILANVEKLRLLSKLERAGLLSALEKNGVTLSALEKSGALSTAESLGLISLVADRWVGGGGWPRELNVPRSGAGR